MKKYKFTIQGNAYAVEILNLEDNIAEIDVNGTVYKVEISQETKMAKTPRLVRKTVEPSSEGAVAKTAKPTESTGVGKVKAPLPGVILEMKSKVGQAVKVGDRLLVMEAMKMENNINSDRDGVITAIMVKEGDSVLEGDVLVEIGSN